MSSPQELSSDSGTVSAAGTSSGTGSAGPDSTSTAIQDAAARLGVRLPATNSGGNLLAPPVELAVTPGKACGPFAIGSGIGRAIHQTQLREFRFLSKVELKYSDEHPFDIDMAVHLPRIGLLLRFEPVSQKLRCVQLYDFAAVRLTYRSHEFCSRKVLPTCLALYKLFGPTFPGDFDSATKLYILHYPGISFVFPIPDKYSSLYKQSDALPLEFPDGTTPVCTRIFIYHGGSSIREVSIPSPQPSLSTPDGVDVIEEVVATVRRGLVIKLATDRQVSIILRSTTAQDVITDLGAPGALFYKEDDKMSIHNHRRRLDDRRQPQGDHPIMAGAVAEEDDEEAAEACDYFLCYFHIGMDILFDGQRHVCKKIVMHTNLPGHVEFNLYTKCQFRLQFPDPAEGNEASLRSVTSEMDWNDILNEFGPASGKPAVVERGSRTPDPFGPTILNGYDGVIFEITKHGYQAAVTLY